MIRAIPLLLDSERLRIDVDEGIGDSYQHRARDELYRQRSDDPGRRTSSARGESTGRADHGLDAVAVAAAFALPRARRHRECGSLPRQPRAIQFCLGAGHRLVRLMTATRTGARCRDAPVSFRFEIRESPTVPLA